MFESIFTDELVNLDLSAANLLIALTAALVIGAAISLTYMKTHQTRAPSQGFSVTLVVLPAVVTVIILLIGNSVARAFSLAGAFQIIRFRSAPGDPKDITFVLFSMAVGLCCGMGYIAYGALAAAVLCIVMIILQITKFGQTKAIQRTLKITIPENLDYRHAFDDIFSHYTASCQQTKVKTTDLGSLFELHYSVTPKANADEKAFIDALRCRNGNLTITLALNAPDGEF